MWNSIKSLFGGKPRVLTVEERMRADWDERARKNARYFVATGREQWDDEAFFASGRRHIQYYILPFMGLICGARASVQMRVLEIGCGAGRMTRGLSELFGSVDAVDVSPEMIERARSAIEGRRNVSLHVGNGADLSMFADGAFDFAFSVIVFQHIPTKAVITNYIRETHRVLRQGSIFKFQVQGAPIKDEEANTWVGVGVSEDEMRGLASEIGFDVLSTSGAGTQDYWLTFRKT
jgi:SAM-dependent methyltransferase